jgi:hypothetical protein
VRQLHLFGPRLHGALTQRGARRAENLHKLKQLEYLNLALNNIEQARRPRARR